MAGFWRIALSVIVASFVTASAAHGFNGRFGMGRAPSPPTTAYSYYYAVPFYYYCPPTGPTVIPVPDARPGLNFANPIPAPPSQTGEPPLHKKDMPPAKTLQDLQKPVIVASHAIGGTHVAGKLAQSPGRCRVGFWNLTNRDVTLMVEGKTWTLPKDRAVTLDVEGQFVWQIEGRTQTVERVADGLATHEVVIRD